MSQYFSQTASAQFPLTAKIHPAEVPFSKTWNSFQLQGDAALQLDTVAFRLTKCSSRLHFRGTTQFRGKGWPMKYSASFVKSSFTPVYLINNAMKDKIVFPITFPSHIILYCCLMGIKMLKSLTQTRLSRSYLIKKQGSFSLRILLCQDDMMSARQKPDPADKRRKG